MKTLNYFKRYKSLDCTTDDIKIIGVNKIIDSCKCKDEVRKLIENYIELEKLGKPDLHYKNTSEHGIIFQEFCNHKITEKLYSDIANDEYCRHRPKSFMFNSLSDFMSVGKISFDIKDDIYLINMYLSKFYKKEILFNQDVYQDFLEMYEFFNRFVKTSKEDYIYTKHNISKSYIKKQKRICIDGEIDYHTKNKIFDLKCVNKPNYTRAIEQCLIYTCLLIDEYQSYWDYDIQEVGVINPILGSYCHMNLDNFGKDNIEKFCNLMFKEV